MRAYSQEVRQQVLRAVDEGTSRAEIIERYQVSRATIKRYLKQRRETGNVLPRSIPGRPPRKKAALQKGEPALLEAHPEARKPRILPLVGSCAGDVCEPRFDKPVDPCPLLNVLQEEVVLRTCYRGSVV